MEHRAGASSLLGVLLLGSTKEGSQPMARETKTVGKDASVHPKTVSEHKPFVPRENRGGARRRNEKWNVTVNRDVWTQALAIAGGDARRIEVVSATEVVVHNHAR